MGAWKAKASPRLIRFRTGSAFSMTKFNFSIQNCPALSSQALDSDIRAVADSGVDAGSPGEQGNKSRGGLVLHLDRQGGVLGSVAQPGSASLETLAATAGHKIAEFLPSEIVEQILSLISEAEKPDSSTRLTCVASPPEPGISVELALFETGGEPYLLIKDATPVIEAGARNTQLEIELSQLRATVAVSQELLQGNNQRLNESLAEVQRVNAELVAVNRLKDHFVANTGHELRTPINAIIGSLALITDGLCDNEEEKDSCAADALDAARNLLGLINTLLDVSKLDAGKLDLEIEQVDVEETLNCAYEKYSPIAERAGLEFNLSLAAAGIRPALCDATRLRQVLEHLLDNAFKFTESGFVRLGLEYYPDDDELMIVSIQDSGVGLPNAHHERVFEMFVQADGSSSREHEGAGLGLSICKRLVESMGGQIWIVKNGPNNESGTTVSFTLKAATTSAVVESATTSKNRPIDEDVLSNTF